MRLDGNVQSPSDGIVGSRIPTGEPPTEAASVIIATSSDGPGAPDGPDAWAGRVRWITAAGVASLAIPFVAVIVLALTRPWAPSTDLALMELRTLDVGGPATPLVGPYSRFGWYHPGPLAFWVLAVPYRLLGAQPVGMLIGTAMVHAAAAAGCLALARRRGGRALTALVALMLALLIGGF